MTHGIMSESGTRAPRSVNVLASSPKSVPRAAASRRISPVEITGIPKWRESTRACVPLPAPGDPSRINTIPTLSRESDDRETPLPGLLDEALVVPHHEMRLQALHRVQRHAYHD